MDAVEIAPGETRTLDVSGGMYHVVASIPLAVECGADELTEVEVAMK